MKKITPLRAIKIYCIDCMGGNARYVKECTSRDCALYGFRQGRKPKSVKKG